MHSSDEFRDLGFRVATLAPSQPVPILVPAVSDRRILALLLALAGVAATRGSGLPPARFLRKL